MDEDMTEKDAMVREVLKFLPDEARNELMALVEKYESEEEFVAAIMVGSCPNCGSASARDMEGIPGVDDATIGFCCECGLVWCTECGITLKELPCKHWDVCDKCNRPKDEYGGCIEYLGNTDDCPIIQAKLFGEP